MEAIVFDGQKARYEADYPMPVPAAEESLVRIELAGLCNTDREVMRGYRPNFRGVMGHEFVGVVVPGGQDALLGQRVVGELNIACGRCLYCNTGRPHHCENRRVPGLDGKDGCFAEYMAYPTHLLHVVPQGLAPENAVYCEPLAAALEILEQNHLPPSRRVAILGDGRLALMVAQVVAANGTPVTVFGRSAEKLKLFERFADTALKPAGSFETVVEATGTPEGLNTALSLVRSCGLLVVKSTYAGLAQLDASQIVVREITLRGSRCGPFVPALNLLRRGLVQLPGVQVHPLRAFQAAFAGTAFKAAFAPGAKQ